MAIANADISPHAAQSEMVAPSTAIQPRVASVDIFRGLTILVMIFVNDVAGVKDLPWWTYHLPANVNGMTYVDMVFPFFLFIVGISLPLSVRHRLSKTRQYGSPVGSHPRPLLCPRRPGHSAGKWRKNGRSSHGCERQHLAALTLLGAILFWNIYPRSEKHKTLFKAMKLADCC